MLRRRLLAIAREPVAAFLDSLIAMDAERIARESLALLELKVGLVVADERGGWTNRWTTNFSNRFEQQPLLARGFAVALPWAGSACRRSGSHDSRHASLTLVSRPGSHRCASPLALALPKAIDAAVVRREVIATAARGASTARRRRWAR